MEKWEKCWTCGGFAAHGLEQWRYGHREPATFCCGACRDYWIVDQGSCNGLTVGTVAVAAYRVRNVWGTGQ